MMYQKENEASLVRMAAGYAWDWISKNDKSKEAINEVVCIHSVQGYDLNYAFIIFFVHRIIMTKMVKIQRKMKS